MRVRIYQVDAECDRDQMMFRDWEAFQNVYGDHIPMDIYRRTFDGELDVTDTEQVFSIFNLSCPEGHIGRSLSVSDVVEFVDTGVFYFCDFIGFKTVAFGASEEDRRGS